MDASNKPVILEPGDIVFVRGTGFLSRSIRFFSRSIGESRTQVSHVGVIVQGGPIADAVIVEALSKVRKRSVRKAYFDSKCTVGVYRLDGLLDIDKASICYYANHQVGKKYGYGKIALHFLDWMLLGSYVFRRLGRLEDYPICSWLVASAYEYAGRKISNNDEDAAPDDIWDYIRAHPTRFSCVLPLTKI